MVFDRGIKQTISSLQSGDHLCCIYEEESQQRQVTVRFLADGLSEGHKVCFCYDTYPPEALLPDLKSAGVDGEAAAARGQLVLSACADTYFQAGVFDLPAAHNRIREAVQQALAEGYPSLRWASEMAWAAQQPAVTGRLVEFEAGINDLEGLDRATILCLFDRRRFDPILLIDILLTHPKVAVGQVVYDNFYYLPPEAKRTSDRDAARLNQLINTLTDRQNMLWELERAHKELEKRFDEQNARLSHAHQQLDQEKTHRRGAERALRETENRYQKIFDAASDDIFILSLDGRILEANRTACEHYGYSHAELIGMMAAALNAPEYRQDLARRLAYMSERDDPVTAETVHLTRDGRRVPVEINARRIAYEGTYGILGIVRDITERKQAEKNLIDAYAALKETNTALAESEAKFHSLVEASPDGITLTDENGIVVNRNASEEAITGLPMDAVLGRKLADLYYGMLPPHLRHPGVYQEIEQRIANACKTGESTWLKQLWEREILRPNGDKRFIQGVTFPIATGRGFMIGTIIRDLTTHRKAEVELETYRHQLESMVEQRTDELQREIQERQQMEESLVEVNAALAQANADLRESEERYGVLVNQAPVCIMVIQANHFVFVNPAGASRLGYDSAAQMIGLPVIDSVAPDSCNQMIAWMGKMEQAETKEPILIEFKSREGEHFLFESRSVPIVYQGRPAALLMGQDVTERTRYEQQLETSLAEKEVMLREIHHRVKNNLNVIIALIDLQKSSQSDAQIQQVFKELQSRAYSMALVHESLYRTPNLAQVDFSGYLHTLAEHLSAAYQISPGGVRVNVEAEKVALKIETAIPCGLIVNELVTNALKYAFPPTWQQPGDKPSDTPNQVLIRLEQDPKTPTSLCLTVQDNGVGLPPGMDWRSVPTLGLQLVQVLSQQLAGKMEMENNGGVTWMMRFSAWR